MADIRVCADGPTGSLEVDGVDISDAVHSLAFRMDAQEAPQLLVEVAPHRSQEIEATGVEVTYVVLDDPAGWLRSIDPKLLERAALDGAGMGDGASSAELILKALIRMAEGLDT